MAENAVPNGSIQPKGDPDESRYKEVYNRARLLAKYNDNDTTMLASLANVSQMEYGDEDCYVLHFTLNFMNSFKDRKRIRGAEFEIELVPEKDTTGLEIVLVRPISTLLKVSDRESSVTTEHMAGVAVTIGPQGHSASASRKNTKGDITRFEGVRVIQGIAIPPNTARWKIFEEPKSKSGVPQQVKLLAIVRSHGAFRIQVKEFMGVVFDWWYPWRSEIKAHPEGTEEDRRVLSLARITDQVRKDKQKRAKTFLDKVQTNAEWALDDLDVLDQKLKEILSSETIAAALNKGLPAQDEISFAQSLFKACNSCLDSFTGQNDSNAPTFRSVKKQLTAVRKLMDELQAAQARQEANPMQAVSAAKDKKEVISKSLKNLDAHTTLLKVLLQLGKLETKVRESDFVDHDQLETIKKSITKDVNANAQELTGLKDEHPSSVRRVGDYVSQALNDGIQNEEDEWVTTQDRIAGNGYRFRGRASRSENSSDTADDSVTSEDELERVQKAKRNRRGRRTGTHANFLRFGGRVKDSDLDAFDPVGPGFDVRNLA